MKDCTDESLDCACECAHHRDLRSCTQAAEDSAVDSAHDEREENVDYDFLRELALERQADRLEDACAERERVDAMWRSTL